MLLELDDVEARMVRRALEFINELQEATGGSDVAAQIRMDVIQRMMRAERVVEV